MYTKKILAIDHNFPEAIINLGKVYEKRNMDD